MKCEFPSARNWFVVTLFIYSRLAQLFLLFSLGTKRGYLNWLCSCASFRLYVRTSLATTTRDRRKFRHAVSSNRCAMHYTASVYTFRKLALTLTNFN